MNTISMPDPLNLRELLMKTGLVSAKVLNKATQFSALSGKLLGCVLLSLNEITTPALDAALFITSMVRSGAVTNDEAIDFIKSERKSKFLDGSESNLMTVLRDYRQNVTVGKLCMSAGLISEFECLVSLEKALVERKKIGELLVEEGLITARLLRIVLILQNQARSGVFSAAMASLVLLKLYKDPSLTFLKAVSEASVFDHVSEDERTALFLMRAASLVTLGDIKASTDEFSTYHMSPIKALIASGRLSQHTYQNTLSIVEAVKHRRMTYVEAVATIRACARTGRSYAQTGDDMSKNCKFHTYALKALSSWRFLFSFNEHKRNNAMC